ANVLCVKNACVYEKCGCGLFELPQPTMARSNRPWSTSIGCCSAVTGYDEIRKPKSFSCSVASLPAADQSGYSEGQVISYSASRPSGVSQTSPGFVQPASSSSAVARCGS